MLALGRGTDCSENGMNGRNVKGNAPGTSIGGVSARSGGSWAGEKEKRIRRRRERRKIAR
jgi:hypothetical protein